MSYENIDVDEFKEKMKDPDTIILDVRTEVELEEGAVPGHQMINFMSPDFAEKIEELDKDKTYLIYCRSGGRSAKAAELMTGKGFSDVYNLLGGIHAWNEANAE